MTKRTVAIVGASRTTRHLTPWDNEDVEIWTINEAAAWPWVKRFDAIFQLHKPVIFKNPTNVNDPNHYSWLLNKTAKCTNCAGTGKMPDSDQDCRFCKKGMYSPSRREGFSLYMQEAYPEIPNSEAYPLEEVCDLLFANLFREGNNQKIATVRYLTSSIAFAIALAIYKGFERIELYGIEMATGSEYAQQLPGVGMLIGMATGRGIEVYLPPNSQMLKEAMYGYEGDKVIHRLHFELRQKELRKREEVAKAELNRKRGKVLALSELTEHAETNDEKQKYFDLWTHAMSEVEEAISVAATFSGARQEDDHFIKKIDEMLQAAGISKENIDDLYEEFDTVEVEETGAETVRNLIVNGKVPPEEEKELKSEYA